MNTKIAVRVGLVVSAAIVLLLSGSCFWNPQSGSGTISLTMSPATRALVDPTQVAFLRVYVYADNMNSRIGVGDGKPFAEESLNLDTGTVTVERVPPGTGYNLVLTLGTKPNGSTFVPGKYTVSAPFDVVANHETRVAVSGLASVVDAVASFGYGQSFEYGLLGKNLIGVAIDSSSNIAAATSMSVYFGNGTDSLTSGVTAGGNINSVAYSGMGTSSFWLNTTEGIEEYDSAGSPTTNLPGKGPAGSILQSAAVNLGNVYAVYYRDANSIGGVYATYGTPYTGAWVATPLPDIGFGPAALDIAAPESSDITLFATRYGAFAVSSEFLSPGNNTLDYLFTYGGRVILRSGSQEVLLSSTAIGSYGSDVYAGTSSGVYFGNLSTVSAAIGSSATGKIGQSVDLIADAGGQIVPLTEGHPFTKLVSGGYLLVALSNHILVMYDGYNSVQIPFAALALGELRSVAIDPNNGNFLVICGSEGLTYLQLNIAA